MRLAVLFSGGKDSTLALLKASEKEEVVCLISILSKNKESYMFHTPNIWITKLQAKAIGLPLIQKLTMGVQEKELEDLKGAIKQAKERFKIEGIVSGAVESVYQAERIQRICHELCLWCFNPLWKKNQQELLEEIVEGGFRAIISGIFAYPLDKSWLGKEIDNELTRKLVTLQKEYGISPSGEGGEIETTVLDAPLFKKRIEVLDFAVEAKGNSGVFLIKKARLADKCC
jgi:ABC transporter with metal-binding/Fe-S-binding domain ATP-binding protein